MGVKYGNIIFVNVCLKHYLFSLYSMMMTRSVHALRVLVTTISQFYKVLGSLISGLHYHRKEEKGYIINHIHVSSQHSGHTTLKNTYRTTFWYIHNYLQQSLKHSFKIWQVIWICISKSVLSSYNFNTGVAIFTTYMSHITLSTL